MIHVIIFINIINCCAFLYVCFPSARFRHCYYYADRFCQLQSVIQIRLLDTMHTMTIDMKNDKIHCTCDNIYNALEMKERNIKFLNICKGIKENNKHRIFSLPCCRFQVSLFSIWNNTTCFIVTIVTNSNFKFSNPRISRIFCSVLTSSRYRSLPVVYYSSFLLGLPVILSKEE